MNILDANVLVNKTKKLNINCGSLAISLAKRKILVHTIMWRVKKKMLRNRFQHACSSLSNVMSKHLLKTNYRAFLDSVTWWPWWKQRDYYVKKRAKFIPPNFLFLGFIYLWLLYPLTAELFRFSLSKTSTQIRLLIKKKLRGTEHGNRCCRHHWQCAYVKLQRLSCDSPQRSNNIR